MSSIYIIGAQSGSTIKIGRGEPARRLPSIQVGNPETLRVIAKKGGFFAYEAKQIEKRIHRGLRRFRLRGEWFQRHDEVERFVRVFRRARHREVEIYVARLLREERCDRCEVVIPLDAPIPTEKYELGRRWILCADCYRWRIERVAAASKD